MFTVARSAGNGIALLVGATAMADIVAKTCSSPQTLEVNANKRADTLWKWVNTGTIEGLAIVGIAALVDKQYAKFIILGGVIEATVTYAEYAYGKKAGLASSEPGTEEYGGDNNHGPSW